MTNRHPLGLARAAPTSNAAPDQFNGELTPGKPLACFGTKFTSPGGRIVPGSLDAHSLMGGTSPQRSRRLDAMLTAEA